MTSRRAGHVRDEVIPLAAPFPEPAVGALHVARCVQRGVQPRRYSDRREISDVNDLLDANESTRVFVALGDCSVGSICVERIERERHLARPVGNTGLLAKSHAGQHQQEHRRAAHESVCGASRHYRTRTRTLPAARRSSIVRIADPVCSIENWAPMTGSRTPDFSSGISSLHCHRGISG